MAHPPARVPPEVFFTTTFVLSWAVWVPLMLVRLDVLPQVVPDDALTPIALPGVLMPAVAATWLTTRAAGGSGVRRLYDRLRLWRVGRWWLPALLVQPAVLVLVALLHAGVGGSDPVGFAEGLSVASLLASTVLLALAATGEELGWRGLALPALQERSGAFTASVVLAVVTATWHLPYWMLQGALADRGSVLVAVAFHVSFNVVNVAILPVTASTGAFALLVGAELVVSVAVLRRLDGRSSATVVRPPGPPGPRRAAPPCGRRRPPARSSRRRPAR